MAAAQTREDRLAAVLENARRAENAGDRKAALAALRGADGETRSFGSWHFALGSLLAREGRWDEAVAALREAAVIPQDLTDLTAGL